MNKIENFIQHNSPDGGFLQSEYWRKFQESYGRKTFSLEEKDENGDTIILANMIVHSLPVAGKYFYVPRGPIIQVQSSKFPPKANPPLADKIQSFCKNLASLARENSIGWIRVEPNSGEELSLIKKNLPENVKMKKSSVDVQPREILMVDITNSGEEILTGMKQKTRYNIRLSQKRGVSVKVVSNFQFPISKQYIGEFLRLMEITSRRDKIKAHPDDYYRKMFEVVPPEILKLYVAEYQGKIISANIVSFFGHTATYMHGASDNEHRDVMAPYLLQWQQILDAKKAGYAKYDLGGVKTEEIPNTKYQIPNTWSGITRFKTGFAPNVKLIKFPGCWDIILSSKKYFLYRFLQKIKQMGKLGIPGV